MNRISPLNIRIRSSQDGSVLLVVVILLLLASLFVLFALNVGRFEQRASGNDLRAKLAQEMADSGVSLGVEYFNANKQLFTGNVWTRCATDDFPCGAIPAVRRSTVYYYSGSAGTGLQQRLLPLAGLPTYQTATGGFASQQQVGALLCQVKAQPSPVPGNPLPPTECASTAAEGTKTWILTVVSKGSLPGEGSSATAVLTLGAYNLFNATPGIPPVIASGTVQVGGSMQIVTAPNAAGTGVPVSVWTRLEMQKNGTPNTCYFDNFLREGGTGNATPTYYEDTPICGSCSCPSDPSLSYNYSSSKQCQGMDIVDIDNNEPNDAACPSAPNLDILRSEFPPDLFAFVFGTDAWLDTNQGTGGDTYANKEYGFAEERIIGACKYPDPVTGQAREQQLPADTCTLLNFQKITHIGDGVNDAVECAELTDSYVRTGTGAEDELRGLVWVHSQPILDSATAQVLLPGYACSVNGADQIGSPNAPVMLIHDGPLLNTHFSSNDGKGGFYGLLFIRAQNAVTGLDKNTGGPAAPYAGEADAFSNNGRSNIYGAVVVQGSIVSGGGGNAAVIYNSDVLSRLLDNPNDIDFKAIPGSWTDRVHY